MAANLNKTKHRINSINSTKKITKAMELVATVKLKRFKNAMFQNDLYTKHITDIVSHLLSKDSEKCQVYNPYKNADKDLYIVINSNLGLCASYNNEIYHFIEKNVNKNASDIISIGFKGDKYYSKNGYSTINDYAFINERIDYNDVTNLANFVLKQFLENKYRSVKLIYTSYINSIKFIPKEITIFPLQNESGKLSYEYEPIYDPSIEDLIDKLIPLYTNSLLYQRLIESQVCEQASRRQAMENASDNADELIDELTLEYNKARQAAITQEISEVISGQIK